MLGKKLSDKNIFDLLSKGKTAKLKGFIMPGTAKEMEGKLLMSGSFNLEFEQ